MEVLDRYFDRRPSINSKKKNEFPDAFAVEALAATRCPAKQKIYVVSEDEGFRKACEGRGNLTVLNSLAKLYFDVRLDDQRRCILVLMGALPDGTKELMEPSTGNGKANSPGRGRRVGE